MNVDARVAGLIAATVPLAAVVFGASVIELIPRMIVGGVLVFLGLAFLVEWVWDKRKVLPPVEYGVVLVDLGGGHRPRVPARRGARAGARGRAVRGQLRPDRAGARGRLRARPTTPTWTDPPPSGRRFAMGGDVQILRVNGFLFFGSANGLLERIRKRVEAGPLRFLVIDLRRVTGVDSSAVVAFVKVIGLAQAHGFELVLTGVSEPVRKQLPRGGVGEGELVRFEPDLDRGLQRCEEVLLREGAAAQRRRPRRGPSGSTRGRPPTATPSPACRPGCGPTSSVSSPRGRRPDPPGRDARRRVRGGVGAAERGDGDRRRDADAAADRAGRCRRRRGRDVHRRPSHRGRRRRDRRAWS